jgi:hypothetical protein
MMRVVLVLLPPLPSPALGWGSQGLPPGKLAAPGYPKAADAGTVQGPFASPDDIVNATDRAITVLESSRPVPTPTRTRASPRRALSS